VTSSAANRRNLAVLAATIVSTIGGLARCSSSSEPTLPPNRLVFTSDAEGDKNIYIMNSDRSGLQRLTQSAAGDFDPAVSPDGQLVAFTSIRTGDAELYLMRIDGTFLGALTSDSNALVESIQADWSPDGSRLAFASNRTGYWEIFTMDPDGSNVTQVTRENGDAYSPTWSPDGTRIALKLASATRYGGIYSMAADGTDLVPLTRGGDDQYPCWSPDGRRLAFRRGVLDPTHLLFNGQLWVMRSDGSGLRQVTRETFAHSIISCDWSPDGRQIAVSWVVGVVHLWLVDPSDGSHRDLSTGAANEEFPAWVPGDN
jgi:TolB protein